MSKFDDPITTQAEQIASELLLQGLPAAIAGEILSTGVKVVDAPTDIHNGLGVGTDVSVVSGGSLILTGGDDTTQLQSLVLFILWTAPLITPQVIAGNNAIVEVAWFSGSGAGPQVPTATDRFVIYPFDDGSSNGGTTVFVPAKGVQAVVTVFNESGSTIHFQYAMFGSQRVLARPLVGQRVFTVGNGLGGPHYWNYEATAQSTRNVSSDSALALPAGAGFVCGFPVQAGELHVMLGNNLAVTALGRYVLVDHKSNAICETVDMPVNAVANESIIQLSAVVGWHPVYLYQWTKPTGPSAATIAATWGE